MKQQLILLAIALLSFTSVMALADDPQPKIKPGYVPEDAETEKGIWMELAEYEDAIRRSALLVKGEDLNEYVKRVACRVAGAYCNDLRVYVIRNPNFNASMTANGIMQIWTGLLLRVSSEDELAAVIGHELAHYTQLHSLAQLRQMQKKMAAGSFFDLGLIFMTGTSVPVGRMAAVASLMAFNRDQEEEADLLGAKFMAQANYDPRTAVKVWETIVEEEATAAVKSRKPGIFSQTHPSSSERISVLRALADGKYKDFSADPDGQTRHVKILNDHYMVFMEDQIDTNRFGRTEAMLQKHQRIGVDQSLIDFFYGEMYRQRNRDGDYELAKQAYLRALRAENPVADAYLNLGYMYLKEKDFPRVGDNFRRYLELRPDADDRAMIEYYLQEISQ